ncbi:multicopper oxidase family protein [Zooshikella ganghwensis]|uniref:multicopper oxidase family protein n=1 Tax=Zooshikella ganghwensis TaxID=202772 RepID=UPI001F1C5B3E|nr:multicopper oxidase family protein [Zooshikella ganghwensis]
MSISRRQFIKSTIATSLMSQLPVQLWADDSSPHYDYILTAEPAEINLIAEATTAAWGFNGQFPAPVLYAQQDQPIRIKFINKLNEPTTIHWHGLRIPIAMDGVPFLSQPPIPPGGSFIYEFTPPDAGTFWYHPHMNSTEQLGRGLVGAFIVRERQAQAFAEDITCVLKNWHIDQQGQIKRLSIPRYAARMGTPGRWPTVNGLHQPTFDVPAGEWVRLRLLNVDNTLTYRLHIPNAQAYILAIDGCPLATPRPLTEHPMGPGMRLDLGFIAPSKGTSWEVWHGEHYPLLSLHSTVSSQVSKTPLPSTLSEGQHSVPSLPMNPIPEPDLENAEKVNFIFEWAGALTPTAQQKKGKHTFWTINKRAWEGMSKDSIPAPLVTLERGKSYIFTLKNITQYHHPIHLHGHSFTVLTSDKRKIIPYQTDTVLLGKNESAQIAFVADNPGRWMFHCHVIDHMKTGLMGYVTVT